MSGEAAIFWKRQLSSCSGPLVTVDKCDMSKNLDNSDIEEIEHNTSGTTWSSCITIDTFNIGITSLRIQGINFTAPLVL